MNKQIAIALADALGAVLLLFAARYLGAADAQFVRELVLILQAPIGIIIGGLFYADAKKAETAIKLQSLALAHDKLLATVKAEYKMLVEKE